MFKILILFIVSTPTKALQYRFTHLPRALRKAGLTIGRKRNLPDDFLVGGCAPHTHPAFFYSFQQSVYVIVFNSTYYIDSDKSLTISISTFVEHSPQSWPLLLAVHICGQKFFLWGGCAPPHTPPLSYIASNKAFLFKLLIRTIILTLT